MTKYLRFISHFTVSEVCIAVLIRIPQYLKFRDSMVYNSELTSPQQRGHHCSTCHSLVMLLWPNDMAIQNLVNIGSGKDLSTNVDSSLVRCYSIHIRTFLQEISLIVILDISLKMVD